MRAHITALDKPKKGSATKARRARKRAADAILARNAAIVRERDGHRCRVCGSANELHVHHIRYRSQGGDHSTSNLVTLCRWCHESVHAKTLRLSGDADGGLGWMSGSIEAFDGLEQALARAARWSFRSSGA